MSLNWYRESKEGYDDVEEGEVYWPKANPKAKSKTEYSVEEYEPKWIPLDSSFISHACYYEDQKFLDLIIKGTEYTYVNVPKEIFDEFMNAKSKGSYYNEKIKEKYRKIKKIKQCQFNKGISFFL